MEEEMYQYAESVQRIAKKQKALEEGEAEQKRLLRLRSRRRRASLPPGFRGKSAQKLAQTVGVRGRAAGAARRPPAAAAGRRAPPTAPAPRGMEVGMLFKGFKGQEESLAGLAENIMVHSCPSCNQELVKVVCINTTVRMCPECKGVWFPYCVVREFAAVNEWFQQLEPALEVQRKARRRR